MKKLILLLISVAIVACETVTPIMQVKQHLSSSTFDIGKIKQTNIGDYMVMEQDIIYYEGLTIISDFQPPSSLTISYPLLSSGTTFEPYGKLKSGEIVYKSIESGLLSTNKINGLPLYTYCLIVDAEKNAIGDSSGDSSDCSSVIVRQWPQSIPMKETKFIQKGSFRKELVYQGKSGNTIRLLYREFCDEMARPAFYQDLTYDMTETNIIGFREMTIEVIEATNLYIKFVLLKSQHTKASSCTRL